MDGAGAGDVVALSKLDVTEALRGTVDGGIKLFLEACDK